MGSVWKSFEIQNWKWAKDYIDGEEMRPRYVDS
jgi:hypothetical protein